MLATLSAVRDDLAAKLLEAELREAIEAVFTPSPLDLLCLAETRHSNPELADRIAEASGRQFDNERTAR